MSGLGERGTRLRAVAKKLEPPPAVPPFYVESPDPPELRALGWYMRMERKSEPVYLGHSAASAEVYLLQMKEAQAKTPVRKPGKKRATA